MTIDDFAKNISENLHYAVRTEETESIKNLIKDVIGKMKGDSNAC